MKITRVHIKNFRAITEEVIVFNPSLTVIAGPNEVGKSTIRDAIRLLRTELATSSKKSIVNMQPIGRDVGPEIAVDVVTGPYEMRMRKRWLRKPITELEITKPAPEKYSGKEAHEAFEQILKRTTDLSLLDALDVMQGQSLQQPELASIRAIQQVLEDEPDASDTEDQLFTAVEREMRQYFTERGNPTGEYRDLIKKVSSPDSSVQELEKTLSRVERDTERKGHATQELQQARQRLRDAQWQQEQARRRWHELEQLRPALQGHQNSYQAAQETVKRLEGDLARYHAAERELEERTARIDELAEQRHATQRAHDDAEGKQQAASSEVERAKNLLAEARERVAGAQRRVECARLRCAEEELAVKARDIESLEPRLAQAQRQLDEAGIDDEDVAELHELDIQRKTSRAAAEAAATAMAITSLGEHPILVDGVVLDSAAHTVSISDTTRLTVPGVVEVVLTPAATDAAEHSAQAEEAWETKLQALGVATYEQAVQAAAHRKETAQTVANLRAEVQRVGATGDQLRTQLADVRERLAGFQGLGEITEPMAELEAALREAQAGEQQAVRHLEEQDRLAQQVKDTVHRTATELSVVTSRFEAESAELRRLQEERAAQPLDDAALQTALATAQRAVEDARRNVEVYAEKMQALEPHAVEEALARSEADVAQASHQVQSLTKEISELDGLLDYFQQEGLYTKCVDAQTQQAMTADAHARMARRADAAKLLYDTMARHKKNAQKRYAGQFTTTMEEMGREVFGPDFTVEIDENLRIASRTVNGQTVAFEQLSAGAQEQLALLGRLAVARLVGPGGAPLIIDDALGFADPRRLSEMCTMLDRVAKETQVVIFTCQEERYASLAGGQPPVVLPTHARS